MRQRPGRARAVLTEADDVQHLVDAVMLLAIELRGQQPPGAALAGHRQLEVLEHGVLFEHRRLLELAPDAGLGDLRLREPQQVDGTAEEGAAAVRPGLAGDDVHQRGLAGTVRADDAAQLAAVDVQAQVIDRPETVEADGQVLEVEDHAVRGVGFARRPWQHEVVDLADDGVGGVVDGCGRGTIRLPGRGFVCQRQL